MRTFPHALGGETLRTVDDGMPARFFMNASNVIIIVYEEQRYNVMICFFMTEGHYHRVTFIR